MPQQTTNNHSNGYSNGHNGKYDMEDGQSFLFTSESVGEGHPGKLHTIKITIHFFNHKRNLHFHHTHTHFLSWGRFQ